VGSGRKILLFVQEQHRRFGDSTCVVDGITDSSRGRWRCIKGLDRGRERRRRGSGVDSMMAQRLQGGLDDSTGSGEVDDIVGFRENFGGKFWQPGNMSESLW
jgi:hypothetical protein